MKKRLLLFQYSAKQLKTYSNKIIQCKNVKNCPMQKYIELENWHKIEKFIRLLKHYSPYDFHYRKLKDCLQDLNTQEIIAQIYIFKEMHKCMLNRECWNWEVMTIEHTSDSPVYFQQTMLITYGVIWKSRFLGKVKGYFLTDC